MRQKALKLNTVKGAVRTLSAMLAAALDEQLIDSNLTPRRSYGWTF
jgi:hypothetical protein